MNVSEEYEELLLNSGILLASLGVRDIALSRSNALQAVEALRKAARPILGGDVYFRREERMEPALANWYVNPKPSEDRESFLRRGWDTAESYIKGFPEPNDAELLFSMVVGDVVGIAGGKAR